MKIVASDGSERELVRLRNLFLEEWDRISPLLYDSWDGRLPFPLLVLHYHEVVGGLAFTRYPLEHDGSRGLWINALYIRPLYRGRGYGARLVRKAEESARHSAEPALYAYTNVPEFYLKAGWSVLTAQDDHSVMVKQIGSS